MQIAELVVTIMCSFLASSGVWALIQRKLDRKNGYTKMLIGLGHDRIMTLGMMYIKRGWITRDEFENLNDYLYEPYIEIGGNGSAKRIMEEVRKLEIKEFPIDSK